MKELVETRQYIDFITSQHQLEQERREHRDKATIVRDLLRRHLPVEVLRDVEEYFSTGCGSDFLRETETPAATIDRQ